MVTDNLTGLVWTRNSIQGRTNWQGALDAANNTALCGKTDWRLLNRKELFSLLDRLQINPALQLGYDNYFLDVESNCYWSASTSVYYDIIVSLLH